MSKHGKALYIVTLFVFAALALTFRPGIWLVHKPANSESQPYIQGWADGCTSGANSYSLLYAPLLEKPFIKEVDAFAPKISDGKKHNQAPSSAINGDHYKSGWNEGFTLCRFYQSAVYELMQFGIIVATLLFIGYLLARKRPA